MGQFRKNRSEPGESLLVRNRFDLPPLFLIRHRMPLFAAGLAINALLLIWLAVSISFN